MQDAKRFSLRPKCPQFHFMYKGCKIIDDDISYCIKPAPSFSDLTWSTLSRNQARRRMLQTTARYVSAVHWTCNLVCSCCLFTINKSSQLILILQPCLLSIDFVQPVQDLQKGLKHSCWCCVYCHGAVDGKRWANMSHSSKRPNDLKLGTFGPRST